MQKGEELQPITRAVDQRRIAAYAEASGDFNPIHIDQEFAGGSRFGGTIAHGMMIAAMLSELMAIAFPQEWASGGRLKIRFRAPVKPGDTVTAHGKVSRVRETPRGNEIECNVGIRNQRGEDVILGAATVPAPDPARGEPQH